MGWTKSAFVARGLSVSLACFWLGCSSGASPSSAQGPGDDAMANDAPAVDVMQDAAQDGGPSESGAALPPSAHSTSFSPVQGTLDDGGIAGELYWVYRIDHGQPHASGTSPGLTFTFGDEIHTLRQGTLVETDTSTVSGSSTGTTSGVITEQLDSVGAVQSIDTESTASLTTGSSQVGLKETFGVPLPAFLNRTDLDALAVGYSQTESTATANVSSTVTSGGTTMQFSGTASVNTSWTVMAKMAAYTVLGVSYADVVQIQVTSVANVQISDSTGQTSSSTTTTTTLEWLARGIGTIYSEATSQGQNGSDTTIGELVTTNLVPFPTTDAGGAAEGGSEASASEGGGDASAE